LRRVKEEKVVHVARPQKAQQEGELVCPTREEVQEWQRSLVVAHNTGHESIVERVSQKRHIH